MEDLPPLTTRMWRSLHRALEIAQENGQGVVGTEHVLLAFLDDPAGVAGMTLHSVGVATAVQAEIVRIITSEGYKIQLPTRVRSPTHSICPSLHGSRSCRSARFSSSARVCPRFQRLQSPSGLRESFCSLDLRASFAGSVSVARSGKLRARPARFSGGWRCESSCSAQP